MNGRWFLWVMLVAVWVGVLVLAPGFTPAAWAQGGDNKGLRRAIEVQEKHTKKLMAQGGVVGTGVGLDLRGRHVIRVFVVKKAKGLASLPKKLDGVPVVQEVTGKICALGDTTKRYRPAPIGVSTGHGDVTAGTIGARVKDSQGVLYALSNNHVYANANEASIGDNVYQPGPLDIQGDPQEADELGTLYKYVPLKFDGSPNLVDAAIAATTKEKLGNATLADGYGTPTATTVQATVRMKVKKYGRTTSLTQGRVYAVNVTVNVDYGGGKTALFVEQIVITPRKFSAGGDSGSLVVTKTGNHPVGLVFAGSPSVTIANPIDVVLSQLGVTIDADVAPVTDVAVTQVSAPSSAVQGDPVNVGVTVKNVGNQDVTSDIKVTLSDTTDSVVIGTQTISGGLVAGESTTLTFTWPTSTATLGDHILNASHDLADDDAGNNTKTATVTIREEGAALQVASIDPNSIAVGSTKGVTVSGSGFVEGATLTFENGAGPAPQVSGVSVAAGGTSLTASVSVKKGGPRRDRKWDVRVTNPDGGSAVLTGGLTVTP